MLLYLPVRRYVIQKDIFSCKLYVTPIEIVYKVNFTVMKPFLLNLFLVYMKLSRPSFIPYCGITTIERHIPFPLKFCFPSSIGCLQSIYGIHAFRIESVAHGKAAPVDELQIQGLSEPSVLRKGGSYSHTGSLTEGPAVMRSPVKILKRTSILEEKGRHLCYRSIQTQNQRSIASRGFRIERFGKPIPFY
ncbi:hypothetical protein UlMin_033451 [Ulmus minor]